MSPTVITHSETTITMHITLKHCETKLPNSEQPSKGKLKTHKYINRKNKSTTGKL